MNLLLLVSYESMINVVEAGIYISYIPTNWTGVFKLFYTSVSSKLSSFCNFSDNCSCRSECTVFNDSLHT